MTNPTNKAGGRLEDNSSETFEHSVTKSITEVYEFKPGNYYAIEVDKFAINEEQLYHLGKVLRDRKIFALFVSTRGGHALRPIPAIKVEEDV